MINPAAKRRDDECFLSTISPSDKSWDVKKKLSKIVAQLYKDSEYSQYAKRILECAETLVLALKIAEDGTGKLKLHACKFCRVRQCPICQWRRSSMWRARFFDCIPRVLKDHPKTRFIFLTLTVKNCPLRCLKETLGEMNRAWQRLSQRAQFPAIGWVKSVEVTRGKDGMAHPHLHCLLMVKPEYFARNYLSQARWKELWQESLRIEYAPQVRVQAVKPPKNPQPDSKLGSALAVAICETLKYTVKPADLIADVDWLMELTKQLHNTRSVAVGGVLKKYIAESEPEDLIRNKADEEDLTQTDVKLIFDWRDNLSRYAKSA